MNHLSCNLDTNQEPKGASNLWSPTTTHALQAVTMILTTLTHPPKPHHPNNDEPEKFEPGAPPVEPDEGPVPAHIPDDPEHDRVIDPGTNPALQVQRRDQPLEVTLCP